MITIPLLLAVVTANSTSIGILTTGGDTDTFVNDWRTQNINRVCDMLGRIGIKACRKPTTKDELRDNIMAVVQQLQCGDTLALYFNGHGDKEKGFVFDRAGHRADDRYVTASEIREWLSGLACCVSVYVGWHACYSGQFTQELSADPHVKVAVSSSSATKTSHRGVFRDPQLGDFVNRLNWADGFADGLFSSGSLAEIFQNAAREAKEAAEATDARKRESYDDDPQDFKRGHIDSVDRVRNGFRMILKVGNGAVTVFIPRRGGTGFPGLTRDELRPCMDIEVSGEAQFDDDKNFSAEEVKVTHFGGKFHVIRIENKRKKRVEVVYTEPAGLKDRKGLVIIDPLPDSTEFCDWYSFHGAVSGGNIISNNDSLRASTPTHYQWSGHVEERDAATGDVTITVSTPPGLQGGRMKMKPRPGQNLPDEITPCMNIIFEGTPNGAFIAYDGGLAVEEENIIAHVEDVNPETRDIKVTITSPGHRRNGDVLTVKPAPDENIRGLQFCKTIFMRGKLFEKEIRDATNITLQN